MLGILNDTFKPTLVKNKRYISLDFLIPLYGREIWTLRKKDKKRLTSIGIKFFRRTAGNTLFDDKKKKFWKS